MCDIEAKISNFWRRATTARERITRVRSKLFCDEQSHGFTLLFDYVPDSLPDILVLP